MKNKIETARSIVNFMYENDAFSRWLGIEVLEVRPGYCKLSMIVRKEMTNGFGIAHGGITYSLADSALAFASNGHGKKSMSIETSIAHQEAVRPGDVLTAIAVETKLKNKVGWYEVGIENQEEVLVAQFKGTVYRTSKDWEVEKF